MSTRATYEFKDKFGGDHTVYIHFDGYPSSAYQYVQNALKLAWELPRFEADEFAAAFIATNKTHEGGVRLTDGRNSHSDTEYHYVMSIKDDKIFTERYEPDGFFENRIWSLIQSGFLDDMLEEHCK